MSLVDSHLLCTSEGQNTWRAANGRQTLGYFVPLRRYLTTQIFCESVRRQSKRSYCTHIVYYFVFLQSLRLTILLGSSYLFCRALSFMQFFRHLQLDLEVPHIFIGIEILVFSTFFLILFAQGSNHNTISELVQDTVYPSQLMDANQALDLLHSACVQPQNLGLHGRKPYSPVIHPYSSRASQYP